MTAPRVRFAPSPTGSLHVGGARTALYNWLFARRHGGSFILRIEDTDVERSRRELTDQILHALRWLGLDWDEGPFFQSERISLYREAADRLLTEGKAYRAFETPEELDAMKSAAEAIGSAFRYDGSARAIPREESDRRAASGEKFVLRLRMPAEPLVVNDVVQGRTEFPAGALDDFVLVRSDGHPLYHFTVCVDDVAMGITHVIRGVDHLPNEPKNVALFRALGAPAPVFAHLGMILGADGKKLSKRHGAAGVEEFEAQGVLPEALDNFLALLGWSPGDDRERMSLAEMVALFSLERLGPSPSRFDHEKLAWMNGQYLQEIPAERLVALLKPFGVPDCDADVLDRAVRACGARGSRPRPHRREGHQTRGARPAGPARPHRSPRVAAALRDDRGAGQRDDAAPPPGFRGRDRRPGQGAGRERSRGTLERLMTEASAPAAETPGKDFIREILDEDRRTGRHAGRVATRFPPEPNGYLHIGHAKSICLNFGVAIEYGGTCNLRFDDTNPLKEDTEYVDSIQEDVHWLGFDWGNRRFFASDYFAKLYEFGEALIRSGKAFVCDLSAEEVRAYRGTLTEPGRDSPWRDRSPAENLDLFQRMRAGEFPDGSRTLRAKIDMASPNINLRDPALFRIRKTAHHRTGDAWCIYPMYDYAHALSDWIERITHSLCTLEFEDHRPLYDWCLEALDLPERPRQIEFARLNLTYTLLSKRKLLHLVTGGHVKGWNDPRMPTLAGFRRRGFTPEALRDFCNRIGLAKRDSVVEVELLEHCLREDLNRRAPRVMAVLDPVRVVLTNYLEGQVEELDAVNKPEDASAGTRKVPFSRELFIDRDDFREVPPPKYHRLSPGQDVRLRWGYIIRCEEVVKDPATGAIVELRCTYDPTTRGVLG